MTLSERLFEQLCKDRQIRFEPIPRSGNQQTADYRIWLGDVETIVEVKQIERSEHEDKLFATGEAMDAPSVISDVNGRIRNKFDKAKRQLKIPSHGSMPAIIVLYDNTDSLSGMDNEAFMNAMHGDEVVELTVEKGSGKMVRSFHSYGKKKRKVGEKHNRTVSALGRLVVDKAGSPMLFLFHNEFSTNRLPVNSGALIAAKQFVRPSCDDNRYREWTPITE